MGKKNQINIKSINKNANQLQSKVPDIIRQKKHNLKNLMTNY